MFSVDSVAWSACMARLIFYPCGGGCVRTCVHVRMCACVCVCVCVSQETEGNNDIVPRTVPARHVPRSVEQSNAPQSNEQGDTEVGERKSLAGDAEEEDMYQDIGALSGCATPQITTSTSSTTSSGTSSLTTPAVSPRTLPRAPSFSQSLNASPMVPAGNDVHRKQEGIGRCHCSLSFI